MPRPKTYTIDLPLPPSVNRLVRTRRGVPLGNKSPIVVEWRLEADIDLYRQKPLPRIKGPFRAHIVWPIESYRKFDCDNRVKLVFDYLQAVEIVENDRDCKGFTVEFGDAERGRCRVIIWRDQ